MLESLVLCYMVLHGTCEQFVDRGRKSISLVNLKKAIDAVHGVVLQDKFPGGKYASDPSSLFVKEELEEDADLEAMELSHMSTS